MDITRNQFFFAGLVLLFLGIQFRMIETVTLTPEFTRFLAERTEHPALAAANTMDALVGTETSIPPKTVPPPDWLGWSLLSLGSVLALHSFAMPRPS
jgi:hypothetical protein